MRTPADSRSTGWCIAIRNGMQMPGRSLNTSTYRYGFNGKENDNEVKGEGNEQDYGMRIYDPRVGRFLSTDPLTKDYPELTPYQFASNRPIDGVDQDGLEFFKKDNTNYSIDYKPVIDAKGVLTKVNNSAHNAIALTWNVTLGAFANGIKGVNNYFAGGYKDAPNGNAVDNLNNTTQDIIQYHSTTPVKQQLKDLGNAATDLKNYEGAAQILLLGKFKFSESALAQSVAEGTINASKFSELSETISKTIDIGKQEKHIIGTNNYNVLVKQGNTPSILTADAQTLLDNLHSGNVVDVQKAGQKLRVNFGETIGKFIDGKTKKVVETNVGIISNGKNGAHIVPGNPSGN